MSCRLRVRWCCSTAVTRRRFPQPGPPGHRPRRSATTRRIGDSLPTANGESRANVFPYYGVGIITLLVQLGCAAHVVHTERPWFWILPIIFLPWIGGAAHFLLAVVPDAVRAHRPARRIADDFAGITHPGTSYIPMSGDDDRIGS